MKSRITGVVKEGLRIASGMNTDPTSRFNNTIALQRPFFEKAGVLGFQNIYNGTVNISLGDREFQIHTPDNEITCEWTPGVTETFWLVGGELLHKNTKYSGYVYYPCPSDIKVHPDSTIEFLTEKISNLVYGNEVTLEVDDTKLSLK